MLSAPRTDPDGPNSGIRLLPRVFDVKAHVGPRVKDVRLGEPVIGELRHTLPCEAVFLAASPKRSSPEVGHVVPERMHQPIPSQGRWLKQIVTGHFAYYAVPTNSRALSAFDKASVAGPDMQAFVYLAGRGVQYNGDNYFVPVDAQINRDADVPIDALRISDFAHALAQAPGKARIIVLDAARANPYASQGSPLAPGLALVDPEPGQIVAFNAAPGTLAGVNKVHTASLAKRLPARCARAVLTSWKCLTRPE